jgi:hypothetical protein
MASEPTDGNLHDEVKTVNIRIFISHDAANIARSNLEAHGIECWINSDDGGGMMPYLTAPGGVRLLVRAVDAEAAIALLNAQIPATEISNQKEIDKFAQSNSLPRKKIASGQVFIGIVIGVILCLLYQLNNKPGSKTYYHYTNDGKRDEARIYRDGHLIEFLRDRNLDGAWDEWTYYENGEAVRSEYDNNFDGKPDVWWTFSDNGTDTLQKDNDFNGIPDEFCIYKKRIIQQMDMKPNGLKFTTLREIFTNGVLSELWRGGDSNGNFKEVVRYDPFFNPTYTNANQFQLLTPSK